MWKKIKKFWKAGLMKNRIVPMFLNLEQIFLHINLTDVILKKEE